MLSLILGLALAVGLVWREVVVETALRTVLSSRGLGDARFEVVSVGRAETVIENVSLGADLLSARRIQFTYDATELASGRLRDLRIEGLTFDERAARDGTLVRLEALVFDEGGPSIDLSRIVLENAAIVLAAPVGGTVAIDGELDLSGEGLGAALEVGLNMGHTTAAFTVLSKDLDEGGLVNISGSGKSELAGMSLSKPTGVTATDGRAQFTVAGTAQIPALDAAWPGQLLAGVLSLAGDLHLSNMTTSIGPGVLSADLGWALRSDNGSLRVHLPRPGQLFIRGVASEILAALRLPTEDRAAQVLMVELSSSGPVLAWSSEGDGGIAELTGGIAVSLGDATARISATARAVHDASWRLSAPVEVAFRAGATGIALSGTEGSALLSAVDWDAAGSLVPNGEIDLHGALAAEMRDVSVAGFNAEATIVDGNIHVQRMPGHWSIAFAPGLTIATEGVAMSGRLEIDEPMLLTMDSLDVSGGGAAARIKMSGSTSQVSGVVLGDDGQNVLFAGAGGRVRFVFALGDRSEGEFWLDDAQVMLPGEAISLNAVSGRLPLGAAGGAAELIFSGQVRDSSKSARFSPVRIDLTGERDGESISVSGVIETLNRAVRLPLKGKIDLAGTTGRMSVGPTRVTFRKGGLQPGALSPRLSALRTESGVVRISATFVVDAEGTMRTVTGFVFEDFSARLGDAEVAGLAGTVQFSALSPLATAGLQQLTARRLIMGVPVDRPRIRFTIRPRQRGLSVRIHSASADLAGGEISVEDVRWDSTAQSTAFDVLVRNVAIGRLLRDWQVEGITGTGRLSGVIPVRIGKTVLAVAGGRLDSAGAGVIRVDWGSARETLVKSGEQVALTVNALENFSYDSLSVGVDQTEDGVLTLAIGLEGSNPTVLDGYPFRFNINLSGELAPILEAVREGRRIGAGLLQGGLGAP
jgi:hypothetical protein